MNNINIKNISKAFNFLQGNYGMLLLKNINNIRYI